MRAWIVFVGFLVLALSVAACDSDDQGGPPARVDAGADAGPADAGRTDAGARDAGDTDA